MSALRALRTSTFASRSFTTTAARNYSLARMNLLGRVVQDTEVVTTPSGTEIGKYSVVVNNRGKDGSEHSSFFRVSAFDPRDSVRNLKKG